MNSIPYASRLPTHETGQQPDASVGSRLADFIRTALRKSDHMPATTGEAASVAQSEAAAATPGSGTPTAPLFTLRGIGKDFPGGVQALHGIDLDIREGEVFGIIGRSGAGKSTLLRTLNLLERPTAGSIRFDGRDLLALDGGELRALRRRIGMIFQHFNLLSSRTVAANIALPLELAGLPKAQIARRVDELLELVGLSEQRDRYPAQISGGQKQRVGIARALATEPRVLLCDEATSALDPETTQSILELLADINRRLGLTIVLITHQMQVIKAVAHRVAVLDRGRLAEQGKVADIFTAPAQDITRTLLREVIGTDIPPGVRERAARLLDDGRGRIWRLSFRGESVDRPALSEAAERYNLKINMLHGYIDEIQGLPFGSLVVAATGEAAALAAAASFIAAQDITLEEISL